MAKKTSQKRLTIPFDLWELTKFYEFDRHEYGFFILDDSRVVITPITLGKEKNLACLGKCTIDEKHRFFISKNVDAYLGEGDEYYFTSELSKTCSKCIFIYKINKSAQSFKQDYHVQKLLERLS